jgi:hypothetical protein
MDQVVEELRALPAGRRRVILAQLRPAERRSVEALLEAAEPVEAPPAQQQPKVLSELSPWLRERVEAKLTGGAGALTDRSRQALQDALNSPSAAMPEAGPVSADERRGPFRALLGRRFAAKEPA